MKTIQTQSKELIVVEVPEDAYDLSIHHLNEEDDNTGENYTVLRCFHSGITTFELSENKHIDCKILGKLSELSEEECSRFVIKGGIGTYKDYCYNLGKIDKIGVFGALLEMKFKTAKESLISLLQSHGVDTTKNLLLIEKI